MLQRDRDAVGMGEQESTGEGLVSIEQIGLAIRIVREGKVVLDQDLASPYDVPTKALNQAVKRNAERFPSDFMFQLDEEEWESLRSQIVTSRSRGGRRTPPYAFTEQGVAMLSSGPNSPRAVRVNIEIMRTFVRLRAVLATHEELARRVDALEGSEAQQGEQFRIIVEAIRELLAVPASPARRIGFRDECD